jgi:hypothetical protein
MAKIIINSECEIYNGMPVTFKAPCACNAVDGLKVQGEDWTALFTFKDAHGNDLTGIGNLFDKGAIVKAILDTESGGAFVQNAGTNAYLEGRFADMVQSVNGQKGNVILTPERLGAAASSVTDIDVNIHYYTTDTGSRAYAVSSKLYTSGKLFVLDVPSFSIPTRGDGSVDLNALPEGYRILDIMAERGDYEGNFSHYNFLSSNVFKEERRISITHSSTDYNTCYRMRVYGCVDGDAAGGSGGIEPDWVQAVIDAAQRAEDTAENAKSETEQFAERLDALDTGLSDAKKDITAISKAQSTAAETLKTATDDIAAMKKDIEDLNTDDDTDELSALDAVQGVERVEEGGKVYIKGKAATSAELGMVKVTQENGVGMGSDGQLKVRKAEQSVIAERKSDYQPIVPSMLEYAVQSVTHQQMGRKYYPDDMGFKSGSNLPVSYAAVKQYVDNYPTAIVSATLTKEE